MGGKPSPLDQSMLLHGLVLPRSVLMIPFLNGTISRHLSSGCSNVLAGNVQKIMQFSQKDRPNLASMPMAQKVLLQGGL